MQADTIVRRYTNMRVASMRMHWVVPTREEAARPDYEKAARDLFGYATTFRKKRDCLMRYRRWVQADSTADAFLRAVTCNADSWPLRHERFIIASDDLQCEGDAADLKEKYLAEVPLKDGFEIKGRQGFYDCSKAERLLGWVHYDYGAT